MNDIEQQVQNFYAEIWNKKNLREIPNILDSDIEFEGSIGVRKYGHNGFKEYVHYIHSALSDYRCKIEELVVDGEKAFAKMLFSGIHTGQFMGYSASNKEVSWSAAALFDFKGGKIKKLWVLGDLSALEKQLIKNAKQAEQQRQ